jgi:hypothetical protein
MDVRDKPLCTNAAPFAFTDRRSQGRVAHATVRLSFIGSPNAMFMVLRQRLAKMALMISFYCLMLLYGGCAYVRPDGSHSDAEEKNESLNNPNTWWWEDGHHFGSWTP